MDYIFLFKFLSIYSVFAVVFKSFSWIQFNLIKKHNFAAILFIFTTIILLTSTFAFIFGTKQHLGKRVKFVRSIIREVTGFAPYERRVIELLRVGKDKRARKLTKRRVLFLSSFSFCHFHTFIFLPFSLFFLFSDFLNYYGHVLGFYLLLFFSRFIQKQTKQQTNKQTNKQTIKKKKKVLN